jgi:peptide/nickel transport system permease protein
MAQSVAARAPARVAGLRRLKTRAWPFLKYLRRNPSLALGLVLLIGLLLFVGIGELTYPTERFRPLSADVRLSPTAKYPLGTDTQGRDIMAVMIKGVPLTLRVGLIAGTIGLALGTTLAFVAGYYRGWPDAIIRTIIDVGLTIPGLLILILIAVNAQHGLTVDQMGLAVATVAWTYPARTIRSQVLVMREQLYVDVARLSGVSGLGIVFKEMMPNLMPYLAASFVGSVGAAVLASVGLEALGLGPFDSPTLGMTVYFNIVFSSVVVGMWWWLIPPIAAMAIIFIGLFLVATGLDEWANPRLRKRV